VTDAFGLNAFMIMPTGGEVPAPGSHECLES
jgi:hypothetical protein